MATSPEQALQKIEARYGSHPRHRSLHAKGRFYRASFTATTEAATLTRAAHMSGEPVTAIVRFSNGSGDPTEPDFAPDVRGLAVSFVLPGGERTDILAQTLPRFPFRDQEGFFAALAVSDRSLSALAKLPLFALRHPRALRALPAANRELERHAGYAARTYYPFHAFKWLDASGGERFVRYRWLPTISEPDLSRAEARRRGADWLQDELAERLASGPVRMRLEVQIAGPGDDPDDPSAQWPAERRRVIVGELEVSGLDPEADEGIVFDPMRLVDGIEASHDPALRYRPAVYDLSHTRRTGS